MKRLFSFFLILNFAMAGPALALSSNDPLLGEQAYLAQIRAFDAWEAETGSSDVIVAVLDTGIDFDHPDIAENIWVNTAEIPDDGIDNDGNGYIDDVHGWDFVEDDNSPEPDIEQDYNVSAIPHGTAIAGVIGAVGNNEVGVAGLGWNTRIMPLRILDNFGSGDSGGAQKAIKYAVENGADIVNLSFTGFEVDPFFEQTIRTAYELGVVVVAAMGNDPDGGINIDEQPIYPACFKGAGGEDYVIGVAAVDDADKKAAFSNYGATCTDLSAPGTFVFNLSYHDDATEDFKLPYRGGWNGTSIAAPMVAGAAALLRSQDPLLSPAQIQTILKLSADPSQERGTPATGKIGTGRLNVARALELSNSFVGEMSGPTQKQEVITPIEQPFPVKKSQVGSNSIVVAPAKGAPPLVRVFSPQGEERTSFLAFGEGFQGGIRLALGDVDGDRVDEIVVVPGPGGGPQVRIFELDGTLRSQFFAMESSLRHGLYVATGDLDGDGDEEIAVSTDAGGNGAVKFFDLFGETFGYLHPFDATALSVRVALGDIDGDGKSELISTLGAGLAPRIRIHRSEGTFVREFNAYAETFDKGVFVGAGDLDGDGIDEIVTGVDNGGGPHVRIFDPEGTVKGSFFAYDERFRGGVRIGIGRTLAGAETILTAAGPGGGPHVRIFNSGGKALGGFFSGDEANRDGIHVAAWSP